MEEKINNDIGETPPPKSTFYNNIHSFFKYKKIKIVGILLILTLIVTCIYFGSKLLGLDVRNLMFKDSEIADINIPREDANINWKTYTDDEYGFEFKYPDSWYKGKDDTPVDVYTLTFGPLNIRNHIGEVISPTPGRALTISIKNISEKSIDLKSAIKKYYPCGHLDINKGVQKSYKNLDVLVFYQSACGIAPTDLAYIVHNNDIYEINAGKYIDQILPTFKFIDSTSNWKLYRNNDYGFEFKYPHEWQIEVDEKNRFTIKPQTPPCPTNKSPFLCEYTESIIFEIHDNPRFLSLENYLIDKYQSTGLLNISSISDTILGNRHAATTPLNGEYEHRLTISQINNTIMLEISWEKSGGNYRISQETFDEILSTFKFSSEITSKQKSSPDEKSTVIIETTTHKNENDVESYDIVLKFEDKSQNISKILKNEKNWILSGPYSLPIWSEDGKHFLIKEYAADYIGGGIYDQNGDLVIDLGSSLEKQTGNRVYGEAIWVSNKEIVVPTITSNGTGVKDGNFTLNVSTKNWERE
jgi:hypothetical protein